MTDDVTVKSPCISLCALNKDDICEGCYRSAGEIADWTILSNQQKQQVLLNARQRFRHLNKDLLL